MSRHRSITRVSLAVVALVSTIAMGTASAKECKTDSDCASGFGCVLGDSSGMGGSSGSSEGGSPGAGAAAGTTCAGPDCPATSSSRPAPNPGPTPVDGGATPQSDPPPPRSVDGGIAVPPLPPKGGDPVPPATTGVCQPKPLVCTSKADCPANLDCLKDTTPARPSCGPDTTCDPSLPVSESGTCKAVCNVDSDCPAPLVCKLRGQICSGGGSVSSDGTVTTIPTTCTGGYKICSYEPVTCSTNAECTAPNYQCAKVSEYQSCTGAAPSGCPRTKGDADVPCTPTPPEPPVCTSTVVNNCMPKEIRCDAGQACPSGWSCFDFTSFDNGSIPGWSTPLPSKACLPDGLILTIMGQAASVSSGGPSFGTNPTRNGGGQAIDLGGKGGTSGTSGTPASTGGESTPPQVTPIPVPDGQERPVAGDAGAEVVSKVRGGGCSLGGARDSQLGLGLTLALAGLVLRLARRRK